MKKITLIIIALLVFQFSYAQKNIIKISPLGLTWGEYNLQYERMITDYTSASISASYIQPNFLQNEIFEVLENYGITRTCNGGAVRLDYRMYSKNKPGPQGFYIGPYLRYTGLGYIINIDDLQFAPLESGIDNLESGFRFAQMGLGVKLGAQWLLFNCVTVDWNFFGLGVDYYLLKLYSEGVTTIAGESKSVQKIDKTDFFLPGVSGSFSISYAF
jgi:hypothetical protein